MTRSRSLLACFALVTCMGEAEHAAVLASPSAVVFEGTLHQLDVMTYNVKGLPWPLASDRPEALSAIGNKLATMRRTGDQPHIVVLQEAFSDEARLIGSLAGYAYSVGGPSAADRETPSEPPIGHAFAAAASVFKGEMDMAALDSGLVILSDFPITRVEKFAFPDGACAGFDCLAAKGVVISWIALPGENAPIAIATTHLNSKRSSGVPMPRANRAFAWQWEAARQFIEDHVLDGTTIVFAGDFNVGGQAERTAFVAKSGPALTGGSDALAQVLATGFVPDHQREEAKITCDEKTDVQFYRNGTDISLTPIAVDIDFPELSPVPALSDHPGYTVRYQLGNDDAG